ncbi:MAG TPA: hypothetical protein VKO42_04505 [Patescibacteria group bacterium]|nr:hypothetical protein [Patescibacteria group bacterium]
MPQDTLQQFLSYTSGQKEIPLVIAPDEQGQKNTEQELEKQGFEKTEDIADLLNKLQQKGSYYFSVSGEDDLKKIYDLVVQYPMNQIQMLVPGEHEKRIIEPDYPNLSVVFLISKETLEKIQKQGFNLLAKVGITYQI